MPVCPQLRLKWMKIVSLIAMGAAAAAGLLHGASPLPPASGAVAAKREKVDPIEANGKIFEGWPKPDVALVFSGKLDGYLEPCGCAGLENQKGGLKRRFTFLKQLRDQGWPVIAVDAGGQEKKTGVQALLKTEFAYQALAKMGYDAIGFGENDLKMDLLQIAINMDPATNPLVSANVAIGDFDSGYTKRYEVIEKGGLRIGITTVLGKQEVARRKNAEDLKLLEPYQAIPDILPALRDAKCDHLVLLVSAEPDEAKDLARRFPEFDWVLATQGTEVPPKEPAKIEGTNAHLVQVGEKAEYVVVVGFYKEGTPAFRYQRVPLDHRFADAPEIHKMQVEYQRNLQNLGWSGLELKPTPHPTGRKFVGSKTCAACHTQAAEVFDKTPHAHATETLEKRTDPPRLFDPECLSCHVTGWEPQKYFPFETGYVSLEKTPDLVGNGCENCHGPAARHAAAENGDLDVTQAEMKQLRAALRLTIVENEGNKDGQEYKKGKVVQMCVYCHDQDNSPEFDFQKYWPKVKHVGKD
jgi:Cytochrome c554 and c-prime